MTASETVHCPFCQVKIGEDVRKCRHCGEWVARSCDGCGTSVRGEWAARGLCAECQRRRHPTHAPQVPLAVASGKSRGLAAILAFFTGGIGLHRFYLGNWMAGFIYLVFCWTLIPTLAGWVEGVRYMLMDDVDFKARYSP